MSKTEYIASGIKPDGYFGDRTQCHFVYDPESKKTLLVWHGGFFNSGLPFAIDANESLWLLENHPIANLIRITQ